MSYTELEHGYQGLRKARPAFYVGEDAVNVRLVKNRVSLQLKTISNSDNF